MCSCGTQNKMFGLPEPINTILAMDCVLTAVVVGGLVFFPASREIVLGYGPGGSLSMAASILVSSYAVKMLAKAQVAPKSA